MATPTGRWTRSARLWRKLRPAVHRLRSQTTPAEQALWERLRGRRLAGHHFRRQHPIGVFVADFCCPAQRLVIELDGPVHLAQRERDADRQAFLEARGYTVLRFPNDDVLSRTDDVVRRIREHFAAR